MAEARDDATKAQAYAACTGMISTIDNVLDDSNDFFKTATKQEKKDRIMRTAGYLEYQAGLSDWGSEDFTAINAAVAKAKAYTV
jgi:hypothetical protein